MNRYLTLWGLIVFLGVLVLGCGGSGTRNSVPEKTEAATRSVPEKNGIRNSVLDQSGQAAGEENPIWPVELQKSLSSLQKLWQNDHSLAPFFLKGEDLKANIASELPQILEKLETDSPLVILREEMQPYPWWHVQAGPEGKRPVLFWDYGFLLQQTRDTADRAFFQLCVDWFPTDSIEYFQANWQLPMKDTLLFSMLGSGIHRSSLGRIRKQLAMGSPYATALSRMQRTLIEDILWGKDYWYDTRAIVSEIDSILQHEARFFPKPAYDSLPLRRQAFRAADSLDFGLHVNWRAGG